MFRRLSLQIIGVVIIRFILIERRIMVRILLDYKLDNVHSNISLMLSFG